jgi:hypothetical protein
MKHIKLFEVWSSRFNRTLQGASAIATSTNKGFGRAAKSVRDYAERQISEEEFTLELEDGKYVIITHDPDFLLKPIAEFTESNPNIKPQQVNKYFKIPVKIKEASPGLANDLFTLQKMGPIMLGFRNPRVTGKGGIDDASLILGPSENKDRIGYNPVRFSDRAGLENFLAMAMQAIITSPEPGFSASSTWVKNEPSQIGMETLPEGMTQEKFDIRRLIQDVVLKRDIREFIM